jgi:hypothetical protein
MTIVCVRQDKMRENMELYGAKEKRQTYQLGNNNNKLFIILSLT